MRMTDKDLSRFFREHKGRLQKPQADCLSQDFLLRATAGKLSRRERQRMAEHFSNCSDCADEYRLLLSVNSWSREAAGPENEIAPLRKSAGFFQVWGVPLLSAAAVLLLVVSIGMGARLIVLETGRSNLAATYKTQIEAQDRALEQIRKQLTDRAERDKQNAALTAEQRQPAFMQPQPNAAIVDLDPADLTRGLMQESARDIRIPVGAQVFTLILNTADQTTFPDYSLEILDAKSVAVWSGTGLEKSPAGNFTLALSRTSLPSGVYRMALYGVRGGQRQRIEEYSMRIRYE